MLTNSVRHSLSLLPDVPLFSIRVKEKTSRLSNFFRKFIYTRFDSILK